MNNFFLTLDLEEWYHLDYFKDNTPNKVDAMVSRLTPFFDMLDKYDVKITVFVLGELVENNIDLIKDIDKRGHEIAIHGWDHNLLTSKSTVVFLDEIVRTKLLLESIINKAVVGYRSPCFSLDNEKLNALNSIGIKYDSSYIQFKEHPLYGSLNLKDYTIIDNLIYKKDNFFEFELPTIKILSKAIPISGGGYFRLFPKFIFSILWEKYLKQNRNFVMYIHPFELTEFKVNLNNQSLVNKIRYSIGRKNNLNNLEWLIKKSLDRKFNFITMRKFIEKSLS